MRTSDFASELGAENAVRMRDYFLYAHRFGLRKSNMGWLIFLGLAAMVFEAIGISIFIPIFQYARLEGDAAALAEQGDFWNRAIEVFEYFGVALNLETLLIVAMVAFLCRQGFVFVSSIYRMEVSARFVKEIRDRLFRRYLDADTEYQEQASAGDLSNAMTIEVNRASSMILMPIDIVINSLIAALYVGILMMVSMVMTTVAIIILLAATQLPRYWIKQSVEMGRSQATVNSELSQYLLQRLHQPRLMRLQGTADKEWDEFVSFTDRQKRLGVKKFVLKTKTQLTVEPFVILASLAFVYFAITVYRLPLELIGIYLVIALRLIPIAKITLGLWQTVKGNIGSFENVNGRFAAMGRHQERESGVETFQSVKKDIRLVDVTYRYPLASNNALNQISVSIPAGKVTALVGGSGSGKSTLVDLLPRLRRATSGRIEIDGKSIEGFSISSLRAGIRFVSQMSSIYSGTLRSHICYGLDGQHINEKSVTEALETVGLTDFVGTLPKGVDTSVGEHGSSLSGGQKQRLELARALVRKVSLLILDEPTSALDAISASEFHDVIERINRQQATTVIYIAHTLQFVKTADHIIVLQDGQVEAQGIHSELLNTSRWYRKAIGHSESHAMKKRLVQ